MALTHPAAGSLWRRTRARSLRWVARYAAVVPDAPQPAKTSDNDDGQLHGLGTWERWLAGLVGLAGIIAGGLGVFLSDNQAGTTAILLLGAVFLLMAVQGTAIIKAGKDTVELERRQKRVALDMTGRAAEEIEQKDLPAAEAYREAAKAIDPSIRNDPAFKTVDDKIYTTSVMEAIIRVLELQDDADSFAKWPYDIEPVRAYEPMNGIDLTITNRADKDRRVTVRIRRRLQRPNSNTTYVSVLDLVKGFEGNILIVTELEPPKNVIDKAKSIVMERLQGDRPRNVEVARWNNADDDPVLRSKLIEWLA